MGEHTGSSSEPDIFRDSAVRYLGYSNEVGEAFRSLVKKVFVNGTYVVAISYVLADTTDKALKKYNIPEAEGGGTRAAIVAAGDTVLWQLLASVIVPGITINRLCWGVSKAINASKIKHPAARWVPTIIGLASIPLIIHPIDNIIHVAMDETYRKYVK